MTGLVWLRARWYSPTLAQFLSHDPEWFVDAPNLYAYAAHDPINKSDAQGLGSSGPAGDGDDDAGATLWAQLAFGANVVSGGVRAAHWPRDTAGRLLFGPLNLYSGQPASALAQAPSTGGYSIHRTPYYTAANAAEEALRRQLNVPTGNLPQGPYNAIWNTASRNVVRDAAISNSVRSMNSPGTIPPGSVQAEIEIPTLRRYGSAMGALGIVGGGLSIVSGTQEDDPTLAGLDFAGGGAQVVGGVTLIAGALRTSAPLMAAGRALGTTGAVVTAPVVASHAYEDLTSGNELREAYGMLDLTGIFAWPATFLSAYGRFFVEPAGTELYRTTRGAVSEMYGVPIEWTR